MRSECLHTSAAAYITSHLIKAKKPYKPTTHFGKKKLEEKKSLVWLGKIPSFLQLRKNYKLFCKCSYFFSKTLGVIHELSSTL